MKQDIPVRVLEVDPSPVPYYCYYCPSCNKFLRNSDSSPKQDRCPHCSQKLDWNISGTKMSKGFVIYADGKEYPGYFTGKPYQVTIFRTLYGRNGIIYGTSRDIKNAKVYNSFKVAQNSAKNMESRDWYIRKFRVIEL